MKSSVSAKAKTSAKGDFGINGGFKQSFLKQREGQQTLVGSYPKGSYAGANIAGFIFTADGGASVDLDNAKEVELTYSVKFAEGFQFALGGKLPGLYGGDDPATSTQCTGGHHHDYCWSGRLMWRDNGAGEFYGYLPSANKNASFCKGGACNLKFGTSLGTGKWSYKPGVWTTVVERVKLNDVGKANGEVEVTVDGNSRFNVKGVTFRTKESGRIRGVMMHTFFGGSSKPDYQSPKDQEAYFNGFSMKVTKKLNGGSTEAPETPKTPETPETPETPAEEQ
jgi:hypothetical protein